ncbi:hypothetical protein KTC92_18355 (plasmid) [Clostridium sp. CM027]|uniref:hypothetical protein n=1 Tax=Clostridium sp. CM027 TaxID=2849865 RepID=UPI001C6EEDCE|nr:hypothetical protein [Clostridium sp. CM027]MBW9147217.1 hypothetical protein [Clostridium sp. CM027]UVE42814.1 hypothetical protein KTC92_18355 [Clostridium sp. CM027]
MKKVIGVLIIVIFFVTNTFSAFASIGQAEGDVSAQNIVQEKNYNMNDNSEKLSLNYGVSACMGKTTWRTFTTSVMWEAAGFIPAGKYAKIYDKVYLLVSKSYQIKTKDWLSLAWSVVDVICAFVPGAVPAKVFWSICKLTPNF